MQVFLKDKNLPQGLRQFTALLAARVDNAGSTLDAI